MRDEPLIARPNTWLVNESASTNGTCLPLNSNRFGNTGSRERTAVFPFCQKLFVLICIFCALNWPAHESKDY